LCALGASIALATGAGAAPAKLSAEEIVARHIAARGGLAAWHAVQTMSWTGKMDAGSGDSVARSKQFIAARAARHSKKPVEPGPGVDADKQVQLPFVVDMQRPGLSRVEIVFAGKTAVQVYDGKNGWKLRPYLNRNDVEPFTAEELKASAGKWDIDGPLIDHAANGTKVEVEGVDRVDGHDAYRLKLTARNGGVQHIWIDAQSFLDVKVEGTPRSMDGKMHTVWVFQRDFRSEQGVKIPHMMETAVDGYPNTHKMVIEKVAVNPKFADTLFTKPSGTG
jgi:outer membrane lipoprotein-sorting protein